LDHSLIESGDIELLNRATRSLSSSILVKTSLDADDGLASDMLRTVKEKVVQRLVQVSNNPRGWVAYCIYRHFEGHFAAKINPFWSVLLVGRPLHVTLGLTFALAPGTDHSQVPSSNHQMLQNITRPCLNENQTACFHHLEEISGPIAIRGRTPACAGMADIGRDYNRSFSSLPVF
jgi:hypothetical protein